MKVKNDHRSKFSNLSNWKKIIYSFPRGHKSASALAWFYETRSSFVLTKKYSSAYISTGCALKVDTIKFIFKKVVFA